VIVSKSRYTLSPMNMEEACADGCTRHSPLLHKIQRLNRRVRTLKTKVADLQGRPLPSAAIFDADPGTAAAGLAPVSYLFLYHRILLSVFQPPAL
ncbi:hypothetical protein HK405_011133, partial [Cladochytrium tenue]